MGVKRPGSGGSPALNGTLALGTLALACVAAWSAPASPAASSPSLQALRGEVLQGEPESEADFPGPGLMDWGWVTGRRQGPSARDVRVTDRGGSVGPGACYVQSETSIVADGRWVYVGFNDARDCLSAAQASYLGFARSSDGGKTFQDFGPLKTGGPLSLGGDPSLALDTQGPGAGTLYLASLASTAARPTLAVGRSEDRGETFTWFDALPGGSTGFPDKEWLAIDNSGGPFDGRLYLAWAENAIRFSFSDDRGETWSEPLDLFGAGSGVRPVVAPDGRLHVFWLNRATVYHAVSDDGGATFTQASVVAQASDPGHIGVCIVPRQVLNGDIRVNGFPSIAVDDFGSPKRAHRDFNPHHGRLYLVFGAHGEGLDEADVFFTTLAPGARSWSNPIRLNDDETANDQFFPEVVATGPGRFMATWTDRREDAALPSPVGNRTMRQFLVEGQEGGARIGRNEPASDVLYPPPFSNPNTDPLLAPCYMGDYNSLFFDGKDVLAAWGDNRDSLIVEDSPQSVIPDPNVYVRRLRVSG